MDPRKDLHSVTLYGPKLGELKGVLIVRAKDDQKKLWEERIKKAPNFQGTTYGSYQVYSFGQKVKKGMRMMDLAFWKPGVAVLGDSPESVKHALDVLDGKKPSMAGKIPDLPAGTTVAACFTKIAEAKLPGHSPLLKQIDSVRFAMGECKGQSFFKAKVETKSAETADMVRKVIEGGKAFAQLRHLGDCEATKIIDAVKVGGAGSVVTVDFTASADAVWVHLQKVIKDIQKMHHQGRKPAGKPAPEKK